MKEKVIVTPERTRRLNDASVEFSDTVAKDGYMKEGWSIQRCAEEGFRHGADWQLKYGTNFDSNLEAEAGHIAKLYLAFRFGETYVNALDDVRMGDELSYAVALFKAGARWQKEMDKKNDKQDGE